MINIPRVWDLLELFKDDCKSRGWEIAEHEDWVKTGNQYHNFLWARTVHLSTFAKIATAHKCAIREGNSYQVVDVSHTAWLFPEAPPEKVIQAVIENPEISKRIAIYDLSWAYSGKPVCLRLNETDSKVFQEFESFLGKKWGLEFKPAQELLTKNVSIDR